jgi:hypothetical protein
MQTEVQKVSVDVKQVYLRKQGFDVVRVRVNPFKYIIRIRNSVGELVVLSGVWHHC